MGRVTAGERLWHPRWGLQFHWWGTDPDGRVGLFQSAFGPVPAVAHRDPAGQDAATRAARERHPEWFTADCGHPPDDCPVTHCPVDLGFAPHLFDWDEEFDDRYTRWGVPDRPVRLGDLPAVTARAAGLVPLPFALTAAAEVRIAVVEGRERLSAG